MEYLPFDVSTIPKRIVLGVIVFLLVLALVLGVLGVVYPKKENLSLKLQNPFAEHLLNDANLAPSVQNAARAYVRSDPVMSREMLVNTANLPLVAQVAAQQYALSDPENTPFRDFMQNDCVASREKIVNDANLSPLVQTAVSQAMRADPLASREYLSNKSELPQLIDKLYN